MSILIRGMEMPEKCSECRFCVNGFTKKAHMYECACESTNGSSVLVDDYGKPFDFRPDWCLLVEAQEPHWIPVTERLPESAEDDLEYPTVLVCFDNGDVDTACFYESTREWGCGDMYDRTCHPTAWMPLPQPYKAEGSEE